MSETIGFAILGTGMVADYHQQAIAANGELGARLVAVAHYQPQRFADIGARFGVPCLSLDEVLVRPDVDVLCICTPSGQHAAQAIAAAQAGKHVLVEKPMALSLSDADAMMAACEQAGVKLGVALQRRAEPLFKRIYEAIQGGDLGDLTLSVVSMPYYRSEAYYNQAEWRGTWGLDGGGVLMNQGIHIVDLLVWYMGDPVEVQAYANTLHRNVEVEDTLVATLRFANGAMATITATTTSAPGFPHRIEIYGTNGGIQVEGETVGRWVLADPSQATVEAPTLARASDAGAGGDPRGIKASGHIAIFRDFIHALRHNRAPKIDGAEGRRSLATILAIYEQAFGS
ncbi:MAG: Gfo/Idh/MocA family protein [Ardenticatenaceae bacterium]